MEINSKGTQNCGHLSDYVPNEEAHHARHEAGSGLPLSSTVDTSWSESDDDDREWTPDRHLQLINITGVTSGC